MAQNKTFVPELPDANNSMDGFYQTLGHFNQKGEHGTVMMKSPQPFIKDSLQDEMTKKSVARERAILGFLYSISNNGKTEFWPLYKGRNVIGCDPKTCDVCLLETSVSPLHATLVIQQQRNPEKVVASLRDEGSEIGTLQNGVNVGFTNVECFNGDILTIGNNYELLLLLIDKKDLHLTPAENFEPIEGTPTVWEGKQSFFENVNEENTDDGTVGFE